MTHGCGSISSGGGGFSGGGVSFTTTAIAGAHYSMRNRNSRTNNDDDCCCAFCWLIAFLFCLVKMPPKTRIVLTWIWVIALACTGGILVAQNYFADQNLSDSPFDMRQIHRIPTSFCSGVTIGSSSEIDTYLLPSSPKVVNSQKRNNSLSVSTLIRYNDYEYWGFYFIKGSSVSLKIRSPGTMFHFYVIKGKSNLNKWIKDSTCGDCYRNSTTILFGSGDYITSFKFSETDQYYFLFANIYYDLPPSFLDITFDLTRTFYDVTTGLHECIKSETCKVDLTIGGFSTVVIDVPKNSPNDIGVTVTCNPRIYMYVIVFGMVPMFVGICISLGIYKYSKRGQTTPRRRERRESQVFVVTGDVLNPVANVNYGTQPPSYKEKPPTYEESVNQQ